MFSKRKLAKQPSRTLGATVTGEPYQPARIYFETPDPAALKGAFAQLKCIDHDPAHDRWVWLWAHEAKKVQLGIPREEIARELHPIVIGAFRFPRGGGVHLDLRSLLRVTAALSFFREGLPEGALRPKRLRIVNRLFEVQERPGPTDQKTHDHFFKASSVGPPLADLIVEKVRAQLQDVPLDFEKRLTAMEQALEAAGRLPLPEVEEILLDEGGPGWIDSLVLTLRMRIAEAMAAWEGKPRVDWFKALRGQVDLRTR